MNFGRVFDLLTLIAGGVILANLVANPQGTKTLLQGINGTWATSVNGMLGKTTSTGGGVTYA